MNKCPKPCGADFQVRVAWRAWKPSPHAQRFLHKLGETAPPPNTLLEVHHGGKQDPLLQDILLESVESPNEVLVDAVAVT